MRRAARGADDRAGDAPLRVCIAATGGPDCPGGLGVYVRAIAAALGRSCQVTVVARYGRETPARLEYARGDTGGSTGEGYRVVLISPRRGWTSVLRGLSHLVHREGAEPATAALFTHAYLPAFERAIAGGVDVVHAVGAGRELLGFAARRVARRAGAALVVAPFVHADSWGDGTIDLRLYRSADALIAATRFEAAHLARSGVAPERIAVSALGPGTSDVGDGTSFRRAHGLGGRPLVLFVGRRQRYKGYHALCQAMDRVVRVLPDACLVVAGAPTEPPFPAVPPGAMLDLGACDDATKADAMAACDALCVPSEAESFGMVYAEAWLHGKPVIVGPARSSREVLADVEGGLSADNTADSVASAVLRLLEDPDLRGRLGANGHAGQQRELTWEAAAGRYLDVFHGAMARRPRATGTALQRWRAGSGP